MDPKGVTTPFFAGSETDIQGYRNGLFAVKCDTLGVHRYDRYLGSTTIQEIDSCRSPGKTRNLLEDPPIYRQGRGVLGDRDDVACA